MIWTIKKTLFRMQQKVMKYAVRVLPFPVPEVLEGQGSVKKLA